ncbi:MAG: hypothetical protein CMB20_001150 [Methanobacteriota archaeon]|nr:MAG: hypothetical protein CMB20_001150 [Euryarchaeota archaeon]|tara:strand:+ start:2910 stop:3173 length:264 start_codon:yes stop_codon:yes gene_type:complete
MIYNDNPYEQEIFGRNMSGEIKKGERIPRKPLPEFNEAGNLSTALSRDGLFGSALDDKNEYGPHAMIILLMIVASITGSIILALKFL